MNPEPTADVLVQLVHRYYPASLDNDDPRYAESTEGQRLMEVIRANVTPSPVWKNFIQRLREEFPDSDIWDTTIPWHDPCYSVRVSHAGFAIGDSRYDSIVCLLSQLAPVYALYASHTEKMEPPQRTAWLCFPPFPSEFQAQEVKLVRLIEFVFGFTRLSNEILFTPVPELVPRTANYGTARAQLIDCLFTHHRW